MNNKIEKFEEVIRVSLKKVSLLNVFEDRKEDRNVIFDVMNSTQLFDCFSCFYCKDNVDRFEDDNFIIYKNKHDQSEIKFYKDTEMYDELNEMNRVDVKFLFRDFYNDESEIKDHILDYFKKYDFDVDNAELEILERDVQVR